MNSENCCKILKMPEFLCDNIAKICDYYESMQYTSQCKFHHNGECLSDDARKEVIETYYKQTFGGKLCSCKKGNI